MWSEDSSGELQGESEESQPTEPTDDAEARNDFRSFQGDFIYRHHAEARVQPRAEKRTFTTPMKNSHVTRSTHTNLDVMQENALTIIGLSMRTEVCQIRELVSQNLLW